MRKTSLAVAAAVIVATLGATAAPAAASSGPTWVRGKITSITCKTPMTANCYVRVNLAGKGNIIFDDVTKVLWLHETKTRVYECGYLKIAQGAKLNATGYKLMNARVTVQRGGGVPSWIRCDPKK